MKNLLDAGSAAGCCIRASKDNCPARTNRDVRTRALVRRSHHQNTLGSDDQTRLCVCVCVCVCSRARSTCFDLSRDSEDRSWQNPKPNERHGDDRTTPADGRAQTAQACMEVPSGPERPLSGPKGPPGYARRALRAKSHPNAPTGKIRKIDSR